MLEATDDDPSDLAQPFLIRFRRVARFHPERDIAAERVLPQIGLVILTEPAGESQMLICVERESQQAHHHALVRLGWMAGERQVVGLIVAAVQVGYLQRTSKDRRVQCHVWLLNPVVAPRLPRQSSILALTTGSVAAPFRGGLFRPHAPFSDVGFLYRNGALVA